MLQAQFAHIIIYIYIYKVNSFLLNSSKFQSFSQSIEILPVIPQILFNTAIFLYNCAGVHAVHSIFVYSPRFPLDTAHFEKITQISRRNGHGEFADHFGVTQTTRKHIGVCKTFFSHNIPRHPDNSARLSVWRSLLIFYIIFCIIYIQGKEKSEFPEP